MDEIEIVLSILAGKSEKEVIEFLQGTKIVEEMWGVPQLPPAKAAGCK